MDPKEQAKRTFEALLKWRHCWVCGAKLTEDEDTLCRFAHRGKNQAKDKEDSDGI